MSIKDKKDWSLYTDPETATDLIGNVIRKTNRYDSYVGKTIFKARALTDMWPLKANQLMGIDGGSTGNESGNNERYAFKARIIGENSPHSFLPDVCDMAYAGDQESTYRIIAMHTTFVSTALNSGVSVTRGDIVTVEMKKTGQTYDLEYGRFVDLSSIETPVDQASSECFSLVNLVGDWAPNTGDFNNADAATDPGSTSAAGSSDTPVSPRSVSSTSTGDTVVTSNATDSPKLIYFYPGVGYGTKPFVEKVLNSIKIPDNTVIILGSTNNASFSSLTKSAASHLAGKTPASIKLGGWSGGAQGLADAISSDLTFDAIIYADPSPPALMGKDHGIAKMYYNPSNWTGKNNEKLGKMQPKLAAEMGANAKLVSDGHDKILENVLKELMK